MSLPFPPRRGIDWFFFSVDNFHLFGLRCSNRNFSVGAKLKKFQEQLCLKERHSAFHLLHCTYLGELPPWMQLLFQKPHDNNKPLFVFCGTPELPVCSILHTVTEWARRTFSPWCFYQTMQCLNTEFSHFWSQSHFQFPIWIRVCLVFLLYLLI